MMPPVFQSEALIKIGIIYNEKIETINDVKSVFENPKTLKQIADNLKLPPDTKIGTLLKTFAIDNDNINKSSFLIISGTGESALEAMKIVQAVTDILLERHQQIYSSTKKILDLEIELLMRNQEKAKQDLQMIKKEIIQLDQDIKFYENEINKRSNIESEGQGRIAESYIGLLSDTKSTRREKNIELKNMEFALANFDATLLKKKHELDNGTYMTVIELPPTIPMSKIGPKRRQLAIESGIIALFASLIFAFIVEFISYSRKKTKNKMNCHKIESAPQ